MKKSLSILLTIIFLLTSYFTTSSQSLGDLTCEELRQRQENYIRTFEQRRDAEIRQINLQMRNAIEQVQNIDFAWQRWEASREEARITREYNNFIELRRLYWEERMEFIRDYLHPFFEDCDNNQPNYNISGKWSISQANGYRGTLSITDHGNGTFSGNANWTHSQTGEKLSGQIVNGTITGSSVSFRIDYGSIHGDYKGTFSQGGNVISSSSGSTVSSTNEHSEWTATRKN